MKNSTIDPKDVIGWGIDADPKNEPTYPMKKYTGDDHNRLNYERPVQQQVPHNELHSNERPSMSAVFGVTVPPSGLSGALRRHAFKYSENHYGHWFSLILADRINVIEGIVDDIKKGHFPNIWAEKGWKAEWKHNKKEMLAKVLVAGLFTAAVVMIVKSKKKKLLS
jgi:hypothetical protein